LKHATTIDSLVETGIIRPPDLVKIDVDGNELMILRGMRRVLQGSHRPRAVQVEMNHRFKDELLAFMEACQFRLEARHHTLAGKKEIAKGRDPESIAYNALFRPFTPNTSKK
jgi:hypothetical protein